MKNLSIIALIIIVLSGCEKQPDSVFNKLNLESEPKELGMGKSISGGLEKNGGDEYSVVLKEGTFVFGEVNQVSVDVIVNVYDPEGEKVSSFDNPASGPEPFVFDTESSGTYKIEVLPFEEGEGEYTLILKKAEPVATEPDLRVAQIMSPYSGPQTPGGSIGVFKDGKMIYSNAFGMSNLTQDVKFNPETPTNIGSVSKQFTAFAILLLEQEGKLSLDDSITNYIPELPAFANDITIKNLLNHTNGLREIYNLMPITGWKGEDDLRREEAIRIVQKQPELQAAPGEEFNYNNTAFILLAEIVKRVTDQEFPEWMKENVFMPLGMNSTVVRDNPKQLIQNASMGYSSDEGGFIESRDLAAAYGAGAIYTTVGDFGKWFDNFNEPIVGGEDLIEKLTTPGILNDGDTMSYALGIGVGEYKGLKRYQHGGADIAHRAMLEYFPEIDAGVVAMSNNSSFPSGTIANKVADAFFSEYFEAEEVDVEVEEGEGTIDEELLESFAGKYKAEEVGLIIEYKIEDGTFIAEPQGQSSLTLKPINDSTFSYEEIEATVTFYRTEDGEVKEAIHNQGGSDVTLRKLDPYDPSPEELALFEGQFYSPEIETFYELVVEDSVLIAKHRNLEDIELTPTEEDSFAGDTFFMNEVVFSRSGNEIAGFSVSNGRTKGVEFVKQ